MKKLSLAALAVALTLLLILPGCGSRSDSASGSSSVSPAASNYANQKAGAASDLAVQYDGSQTESKDSVQTTVSEARQDIKKIIRNASASVIVKDSDEAFGNIANWINSNSGYEFSRNSQSSGSSTQINAVFKLPPEKLDGFLAFLNGVGKVTNSNTSTSDITDQYYDAAARLENLKKGRDQLLEIQKKAMTIDETLKVQSEINRITGDLEALQGKINVWDKMVDESTVTLSIYEESDPLKSKAETTWKFSSFNDILKTMKSGFILTVNTIANILTWIVIFIVSVSPIVAVSLAILFFVRKTKRRRQRKQNSSDEQ